MMQPDGSMTALSLREFGRKISEARGISVPDEPPLSDEERAAGQQVMQDGLDTVFRLMKKHIEEDIIAHPDNPYALSITTKLFLGFPREYIVNDDLDGEMDMS